MTQLQIIDPNDIPDQLDAGAYILDIRDVNSYNASHIKGSQRIDNSTLSTFLATANKDKAVIVCCYMGISSMPAAELFIQQGFDKVYSLQGGFDGFCTTLPQLCT
ncbi:MAG: rhodanese-like domain-containing protein [Gammaproteobacteria bacterium]|jgi:thiosulfate sulfurtransferase|nr:rhodanese-like domain-containing protein [Gammaproteobacteria bacterium]